MKNLFKGLLVVCLTLNLGFAAVMVAPMGVSPRFCAEKPSDIYDLAYNGMLNVGVGTKMYFLATGDAVFTPTWTVTGPAGSVADVVADSTLNDSAYVVSFVSDVVGTYTIDLNGESSLTVNAGKFLGVEGGAVPCSMCHAAKFNDWKTTNHSNALNRGLNGEKHLLGTCVSCHSVGYDVTAVNDGFDDFDFAWPDSATIAGYGHIDGLPFIGLADSVAKAYPDAMARGNIQCEACHGPGSEHQGNLADNRMEANIGVAVCATCHNSGHHYFPAQWEHSGEDATEAEGTGFEGGHARGSYVISAGTRSGCSPCHSGAGYIEWVKEGRPVDGDGLPAATTVLPEATNITCAVCHDPHNMANDYQLRFVNTQLGDGTPITMEKYGAGAQCMDCHRSRRNAATYSVDPNGISSHYGAHHGPQADMLIGTNAPVYQGFKFPTSPHALQGNACVDCHMYNHEGEADLTEEHEFAVGGHSFNMNDAEGNDHVEACARCHGDVGTSFGEKKFYFNGIADHDGDGVDEGLQEEVKGLLEELRPMLYDTSGALLFDKTNATPAQGKALYSYVWVEEDRSFGIHNPAFTVALLKTAIQSLTYPGITAGQMVAVKDIPGDQGFQVRVVWTRFGADDTQAWDRVNMYTVLREVPEVPAKSTVTTYDKIENVPTTIGVGEQFGLGGALWDVVALVPAVEYIEYAAVVPTLHNTVEGDTAWAVFKVLGQTEDGMVAETVPMPGFSTDDVAPAVPAGLDGLVLTKQFKLTWDMPVDKDFGYFAVYRSLDKNFNPAGTTPYATTVDPEYLDVAIENNTHYFYKISAVDVNRNESAFTDPLDMVYTVVSVTEEIPTVYALRQNHPNPFNPVTSITFQLPEKSFVNITVYNSLGMVVDRLVNTELSAGSYSYTWNGKGMASGIYYYRMTSRNFTETKKMLLLK